MSDGNPYPREIMKDMCASDANCALMSMSGNHFEFNVQTQHMTCTLASTSRLRRVPCANSMGLGV
jgi:hypothetical protein